MDPDPETIVLSDRILSHAFSVQGTGADYCEIMALLRKYDHIFLGLVFLG